MKFLHQVTKEESGVEKARSLIEELENYCKRVGGVPKVSEKEFWSFKLTCVFPEEKDMSISITNVRDIHPIGISVERNGYVFDTPEQKYFSFKGKGESKGKIAHTVGYVTYEGKASLFEVIVDRNYKSINISIE